MVNFRGKTSICIHYKDRNVYLPMRVEKTSQSNVWNQGISTIFRVGFFWWCLLPREAKFRNWECMRITVAVKNEMQVFHRLQWLRFKVLEFCLIGSFFGYYLVLIAAQTYHILQRREIYRLWRWWRKMGPRNMSANQSYSSIRRLAFVFNSFHLYFIQCFTDRRCK